MVISYFHHHHEEDCVRFEQRTTTRDSQPAAGTTNSRSEEVEYDYHLSSIGSTILLRQKNCLRSVARLSDASAQSYVLPLSERLLHSGPPPIPNNSTSHNKKVIGSSPHVDDLSLSLSKRRIILHIIIVDLRHAA